MFLTLAKPNHNSKLITCRKAIITQIPPYPIFQKLWNWGLGFIVIIALNGWTHNVRTALREASPWGEAPDGVGWWGVAVTDGVIFVLNESNTDASHPTPHPSSNDDTFSSRRRLFINLLPCFKLLLEVSNTRAFSSGRRCQPERARRTTWLTDEVSWYLAS